MKLMSRLLVAVFLGFLTIISASKSTPAQQVQNSFLKGMAPQPIQQLSSAVRTGIMANRMLPESNPGLDGVNAGGSRSSRSSSAPSTDQFGFPVWHTSFRSQGIEYPLTFVGADPSTGQTTTIPTVIIPYRLVFTATGDVFDASTDLVEGVTPVAGIINSPIFNPQPFSAGSTFLGNTQYGDAMMRANFWGIHSDQGAGYHVLLGTPTVLPVQTFAVGPDDGFVVVGSGNTRIGIVDEQWLLARMYEVMTNPGNHITPAVMPIHLLSLIETIGGDFRAAGFHNGADLGTGVIQTYIYSSYFPESYSSLLRNSEVLGHEIAEWLNDPGSLFDSNFVPMWESPDAPKLCFNDLLEVADPLEFQGRFYEFSISGLNYGLPEIAFMPWFSGSGRPTSVNHWFSSQNTFTAPSNPCPAFPVDPNPNRSVFLGYGSADFSLSFNAVNNHNDIVAFAAGSQGADSFIGHVNPTDFSFVFTDSVQVPGTPFASFATGISDRGQVVGIYFDQATAIHGFLYDGGVYSSLDFPGAIATEALAITSDDDDRTIIAGVYISSDGLAHGFILKNNQYRRVDAPFADNMVITGINRKQELVGYYTSPGFTIVNGFRGTMNHLTPVPLPFQPASTPFQFTALNDDGELVGYLTTVDGLTGISASDAFQEAKGYYNPVSAGDSTFLNGINNAGWEVGSTNLKDLSFAFVQFPSSSNKTPRHQPSRLVVPREMR